MFPRLTLLLALLFTSCVSGPNFLRPKDKLPGQWKEGKGSASSKPLPDEWWKRFGSDKLNALVKQALAANQDLKAASARVDTARALIGAKRSEWFPQLNLGGSASKQRISEATIGANLPPGLALPADALVRQNYRASLEASYELDLWGRVKRGVESARASAKSADDTLAAQRLMLAAEVARNYFLLRSLDAQMQILRDTIKLREDALKLQKSRFEGGMANETDVSRSRTEHELARADLAALERTRGSTEHALAVLCGQMPSSFHIAAGSGAPTPPHIPVGLPSELLERRPDIRAAEAKLIAANADIGVAKADFFPSFKLLGSGGFESLSTSTFLDWENRALSIGPSVTLPIFNGGKLRASLRAAKSRYEESLAQYRQAVLIGLREVEDSLLDLRSFASQRAAIAAALTAADDTAKLARVRYDKGLASYFEVVEADRTVLITRLALAQLDGQRAVSSVLLAKSLGGGWGK